MKEKSSKSKKTSRPNGPIASKKSNKDSWESKSDAQSNDIATLILRDHKPIKELLLILKDAEASFEEKQPAFTEFELTLLSHAKAEEKSFYVHLKKVDDLRIEGLEGDTEHAIAEGLIKEINQSKGDQDLWMAKVKVLAELVDHHVKEEETEVLKGVRKEFDAEKRNEIGEEYSVLLKKYRDGNDFKEEAVGAKKPSSKGNTHTDHY